MIVLHRGPAENGRGREKVGDSRVCLLVERPGRLRKEDGEVLPVVEPLAANMTGKWRQQQVDLVYVEHLMGDSGLKHAVCILLAHHPLGDASQEKCWGPDHALLDPFPLAETPPSQYSSDPAPWG